MSWIGIMTSSFLLQNSFILRRPSVAIFTNINKIVTIFIKKTQEKLKELEIVYQNETYLCLSQKYIKNLKILFMVREFRWQLMLPVAVSGVKF